LWTQRKPFDRNESARRQPQESRVCRSDWDDVLMLSSLQLIILIIRGEWN
jgi:hypothetical protein